MNIFFIILGIIYLIYIFTAVKNGKFNVVESFFWICGGIGVLILSIFPNIIVWISKFVGIDYPPSLLFMLCIIFLLFINFRNSQKIAEQQEKIIELAQNLALLKSKENDK
ncbi:MAG: DUF2304 domain-containing protein [Bacilli bacterium]|nr:DUF2304 domain-containing protein [Bacilli bacterium]